LGINSLTKVDAEVVIAQDIKSDWVDVCRLNAGDKVFARYPNKLFLTMFSAGSQVNPGDFEIYLQYQKIFNLYQTDNRVRCTRKQN
jgi:hypothetical protein